MKEGIILELNKNTAVLITAEGEFLSIPSQPTWSIGDEIKYSPKITDKRTTNNSYRRNILMKKGVWVALAACLMLLIIPLATITEASTYITIDINPSIELELKGDKVVNVKALNTDAEKIIFNIPRDYQDIYSITTYIIDKSKEFGYLNSNEENYIMIGVCDNKSDFSITEFENFIEDKLTEQQLEANILFVNGTSDDKKLADNKNVSLGKYVLQQNKKLEGIDISDEDLLNDNVNKNNATVPNIIDDKGNKGNINIPNNNSDNSNKNNNVNKNNIADSNNGVNIYDEDNNEVSNNKKNDNNNLGDADNPNTNSGNTNTRKNH